MISKPATSTISPRCVKFRNALTAALVILVIGCNGKDPNEAKESTKNQPPAAQLSPETVTPPAPPPGAKPLSSIESLVAPIALYPDPLLAEVLVSSTYPLEIVQAARWLESKPDLATLQSKNWDPSVARLTAVPSVVSMMSDHLDWTTQLGDTFLAQPNEVMDAVQALRKRASDAGYLKDSDLQKVTTQTVSASELTSDDKMNPGLTVTPAVLTKEVISIQPAKADTISVPNYNPEVVYAAPLAPPPATTVNYISNYPASTAPTSGYYPTYNPAPTTTTSSDQWMTFAAGAVVGGLLTWGIMEWTHHNHSNDYYYPVAYPYGSAVCRYGNCWYGGGSSYNRGNINISGNDININRNVIFKPSQLPALKDRPSGWIPNPQHRRGQAYPAQVQNRLGKIQQPALPGNRLSSAQTLPANSRGFGAPTAKTIPADSRLSSADVQQQLKAKSRNEPLRTPSARDTKPQIVKRQNAFENLKSSGQASELEQRRGAASANRAQVKQRPAVTNKATSRVSKSSRPSAFESALNASQSPTFSQRGAASRKGFQNAPASNIRQLPKPDGVGGAFKQRQNALAGRNAPRQRQTAPAARGGGLRQHR